MEKFRDDARPPRLMRGTEARAAVAVEKFVEEHVVAEMRIARELGVSFQNRSLAVFAFKKQFREAMGDFIRRIVERHEFPRTHRAFDFEIIARSEEHTSELQSPC